MWIPRELDATLRQAASTRPAVVLTGCRQAGKTSLLVAAFGDHRYVSLDIPMVAEEAEHSGEEFLRRHQPPVIIDEIQSRRPCSGMSKRTSTVTGRRPGGSSSPARRTFH